MRSNAIFLHKPRFIYWFNPKPLFLRSIAIPLKFQSSPSMYIKCLFVIAFFACPLYAAFGQSQTFAPLGARWYYRPHELTYPDTRLFSFHVSKDTLLDGLPARELACSQWIDGQWEDFPDLNKYVHTNSDSVSYRVGDQWALLFNFAAMPGDTIRSKVENYAIPSACSEPDPGQFWDMLYKIDSVSVETIGGVPLRVQYVSNLCPGGGEACWWLAGKIVERIGAISSDYWWGQGSTCHLGGFSGYLRCYSDALVQYIGPIGNSACDQVDTEDLERYQIKAFPNPSNGNVSFTFSPLNDAIGFRLLDGLGRTLASKELNIGDTALDISIELSYGGMFFAEFSAKSKKRTFKIVKM
jgi:hypothetical protein